MNRSAKLAASGGAVVLAAGLSAGLYLAWPLTGGGPVTGTETFAGSVSLTPAQLASSTFNPTVPLKASGLFTDTGSIYLAPGSGKDGNGPGPAVIKLSGGNINVRHGSSPANPWMPWCAPAIPARAQEPVRQDSTCNYTVAEQVTYTVISGTGSYSNVTGGHGIATVTFGFTPPKLASGACNSSCSVVPANGFARFSAVGPIARSSS